MSTHSRYGHAHNLLCDARLHGQENSTPLEVKQEVERHLSEKRILERSLPSSIVIGPFMVNVESVRQSLSKKRQDLARVVLERLALKLRKQMEEASQRHRLHICNIV